MSYTCILSLCSQGPEEDRRAEGPSFLPARGHSLPPGRWSRSPSLHATIVVESLFWARLCARLREGGARRPWLHRRVVPARGPGLRPEKLRFPLQSRLCPLPLPAAPDACDKAVCEWGRVGMTTSFDSLFVPRPPLRVDAPAPLKSASPSSLRAGDNDVLFVVLGFRASGARAVPVVPCGPLLCTCPWFSISPPSTPVPLASARFARG